MELRYLSQESPLFQNVSEALKSNGTSEHQVALRKIADRKELKLNSQELPNVVAEACALSCDKTARISHRLVAITILGLVCTLIENEIAPTKRKALQPLAEKISESVTEIYANDSMPSQTKSMKDLVELFFPIITPTLPVSIQPQPPDSRNNIVPFGWNLT